MMSYKRLEVLGCLLLYNWCLYHHATTLCCSVCFCYWCLCPSPSHHRLLQCCCCYTVGACATATPPLLYVVFAILEVCVSSTHRHLCSVVFAIQLVFVPSRHHHHIFGVVVAIQLVFVPEYQYCHVLLLYWVTIVQPH